MVKVTLSKPGYYKRVDETLLKGVLGYVYFRDSTPVEVDLNSSEILQISFPVTMDMSNLVVGIVNDQVETFFDGEGLSEWNFDLSLLKTRSISSLYEFMRSSGLWDWIVQFIITDHYEEYGSYSGLKGSLTSKMFPRLCEIFDTMVEDLENSRDWEIRLQDLHWETECFERDHQVNIFENYSTLRDNNPIKQKWTDLEKSLLYDFFKKKKVFGVSQILWRQTNKDLLVYLLNQMRTLEYSNWSDEVCDEFFQSRSYEQVSDFLTTLCRWLDTSLLSDDDEFDYQDLKIIFDFSEIQSLPSYDFFVEGYSHLIQDLKIGITETDPDELNLSFDGTTVIGNHDTIGELVVDQLEGDL